MVMTSWLLLVGIWAITWNLNYSEIIIRPFGYKGNWLIYFLYGLVVFSFTILYGGYRVGYYKRGDIIFSNIISIVLANGITYLQTCLIGRAIMTIWPFFVMTALEFAVIWVWATVMHKAYLKMYPPYKMLVVHGGNGSELSLIEKISSHSEKYSIRKVINVLDYPLEEVYKMALEYESVIICDVKSETRNNILKFCFQHSVRTYLTPKISDIIIRNADEISLFDTPLLICRNQGLSSEQRFLKRIVDLAFSGIGIILASPIMLFVALAIKFQDGGPALIKQERLTLNGEKFMLFKFRSMIVEAEEDGIARLATEGDERITPLGHFIRRTRLDELPQLFNIFVGHMSLVGPRPERPEIAAQYQKETPEFSYRLKVKAGLTGNAQVVGKYNTTAYDKLKLDLIYIEKYSLALDFKLILMTIKIIFMRESSEGFIEEQRITNQ